MRPVLGALSATAILVAASASNQHVMSDKQTLPVQPPGQETLYAEDQPPPSPLKIKTLNPSQSKESSSKHDANKDRYAPRPQASLLSDTIGPQRSISSFSSFTRLQSSTESLLSSPSKQITVLAPLNSAVDALPRKPWESPDDYDTLGSQAYDGSGGRDRANKNLERFVRAHLVEGAPWDGGKVRTMAGREVWWEVKGGMRVIMPDGVEVDRVACRVENGELWLLKGVLEL